MKCCSFVGCLKEICYFFFNFIEKKQSFFIKILKNLLYFLFIFSCHSQLLAKSMESYT